MMCDSRVMRITACIWLCPEDRTRLERLVAGRNTSRKVVWPRLDRLGVKSAATVEQGLNFPKTPPLGLQRLSDGREMDLLEFEAGLRGFIEVTRRLRRPYHRRFSHVTQRQETRATS